MPANNGPDVSVIHLHEKDIVRAMQSLLDPRFGCEGSDFEGFL